jgi:hypothetical protein
MMVGLSRVTLMFVSGAIWLGMGLILLPLGLRFLMNEGADFKPLLSFLAPYIGEGDSAKIWIVVSCLLIGHFKGRYVLGKAANKGVERLLGLGEPIRLFQIYSLKNYMLIAFMMGLGFSFSYFSIPLDIRGAIDTAVGAALINGASIYFQQAFQWRNKTVRS